MAASEGVDLEWAIVDLAKNQKFTKKFSPKIKTQATKCVNHLIKKVGTGFQIYHSDEVIPGIGKPIYAKPEPKTDIVVIAKSKKYFISVKMEGGIQLASGQGSSTADLFQAAASSLKNQSKTKVLTSIINELRSLPTRLLSESNFQRIMREGNEKIINEFIKGGKIIQDKNYELWLQNNKPKLITSLLKFVENNDEFYNSLIYEALSGEKTLSSYKGAVANSILSPSGFYMIDDSYVKKIKSKIKMDLRAKSRGGVSSIAFRIETRGSI